MDQYLPIDGSGVKVLVRDGALVTVDKSNVGSLPDQFIRLGSENTAVRVRGGKLVTVAPSVLGETQYAHVGEENNALAIRDGCIVAGSMSAGDYSFIHFGSGLPVLTLRGGVVVGGLGSGGVTWAQYVATLAPLAWWRFRDASSPAVNAGSLGSAVDLTGAGTITYQQTGKLGAGEAVLLNGTDSRFQCANNATLAALTTFTLLFLVNPSSAGEGNSGGLMAYGNGANTEGWFCIFTGALTAIKFQLYNTTPTTFSTTSSTGFIANTAALLAITYDDAGDRKVRMYLNGSELSYAAQPATTGTFKTPTAALNLFNTSNQALTFAGLGDEVLICSRVLIGSELSRLSQLAGF